MNIYDLLMIETPHLMIRPVQRGDELAINRAINRSLPALQRWMPWAKDPCIQSTKNFVEASAEGWRSRQALAFPMVVIHKRDKTILATTGYNEQSNLEQACYEIGYWIDTGYSGQGYVTEFVLALTRYAFAALNAQRTQICTQIDNSKSIAVATRCGYIQETTLKNDRIDCVSGQACDSVLLACWDANSLPAVDVSWQHTSC